MDQVTGVGQDPWPFFSGGGEMGARMRAIDWQATPLGVPSGWPSPLRTIVELMLASRQAMFVAWGPERIMLYNDAYAPMCGRKHPWALARPFDEVWADILDKVKPILDAGYQGISTHMDDIEFTMLDRRGGPEETHFSFSYTPVRDDDGAVCGVFCACDEITQRVEEDSRRRFLLALSDGLRRLSDPKAVMTEASRALGQHLGIARTGYGDIDEAEQKISIAGDWNDGSVMQLTGVWNIDDFGPPLIADLRKGRTIAIADVAEDPRTNDPAVVAAFGSVQIRAVLGVPLVKDGRFRAFLFNHHPVRHEWLEEDIRIALEVAERTWEAVERARAEEHMHLLVGELNHRVKNTLAIVQSLASQSFRKTSSEEYNAFAGRLAALADAHMILSNRNTEITPLQEVVAAATKPYCGAGDRIEMEGERVWIEPRWALKLSMTLHELCTNATKYGALSVPTGRVSIAWALDGGERQITMHWRESGGPRVAEPARRGFGLRMIERTLATDLDGEMVVRFAEEGLRCDITLPALASQDTTRPYLSPGAPSR